MSCLLVLLCLILSTMHKMQSNDLKITAWNSRGLRAAQAYIEKLSSENDILVLSEHNLYESQLYRLNELNDEFASLGK